MGISLLSPRADGSVSTTAIAAGETAAVAGGIAALGTGLSLVAGRALGARVTAPVATTARVGLTFAVAGATYSLLPHLLDESSTGGRAALWGIAGGLDTLAAVSMIRPQLWSGGRFGALAGVALGGAAAAAGASFVVSGLHTDWGNR